MDNDLVRKEGSIVLSINNSLLLNFLDLTLFQLCLEKKIFLPRFCYHKSLNIVGNCRMCLVEDKNSIKPIIACAAITITGQVIYTVTEMVMQARESVLEYLLINHPLDCPICDQGGECDLQDQVVVFGADEGRFYELKKTTVNKNLGPLVKTFLNRCIYCSRCVRYFEEFGTGEELSLLGRSEFTEIGLYVDRFLESEIAGNVTDLCPVGALLLKPNSFRGRLWELIEIYTFDIMDSFGCSIRVDMRGTEIIRILPRTNEYLNDEWISDKTRFFFEGIAVQRLMHLYEVEGGGLFGWEEFFKFFRNYLIKLFYVNDVSGVSIDSVIGAFTDLESIISSHDCFTYTGIWNLNPLTNYFYNTFFKSLPALLFEESEEENLKKKNCFMVGTNLRYESPVLNMRLRQLILRTDMVIYLVGFLSNVNYVIKHLGNNFSLVERIASKSSGDFYFIGHDFLIEKVIHEFFTCNNFILVNLRISDCGGKELGLINPIKNYLINTVTDITLNQNDFFSYNLDIKDKKKFNLSFFSHYEEACFKNSSIVIPVNIFLEKSASYLNNLGDFQQYNNIYSLKFSNSMYPEWMIFQALNEIFKNEKLSWYNVETLRKSLFERFSPIFEQLESITYLSRVTSLLEIDYIVVITRKVKKVINSKVNDFFRTNIISFYSDSLVQCSKTLLKINDYIIRN